MWHAKTTDVMLNQMSPLSSSDVILKGFSIVEGLKLASRLNTH